MGLVAVGCTKSGPAALPAPPPEISVWITGDSLASGTGYEMRPRPHSVLSGGAAFTEYAPGLILDNTEEHIALYGQPETLLVLGGVADTPRAETSEIIAGMEEFKAAMLARGIRLIWIAEPSYGALAPKVAPLSAWAFGQPESIDCLSQAGPAMLDGVHLVSYTLFAQCVDAELVKLGVEFNLPVSIP